MDQLDSKLKERDHVKEVYAEISQTIPKDYLDFEKVHKYMYRYMCIITTCIYSSVSPRIPSQPGANEY